MNRQSLRVKGRLTMKQLDVLNLWKEGIFDNKIIANSLVWDTQMYIEDNNQ